MTALKGFAKRLLTGPPLSLSPSLCHVTLVLLHESETKRIELIHRSCSYKQSYLGTPSTHSLPCQTPVLAQFQIDAGGLVLEQQALCKASLWIELRTGKMKPNMQESSYKSKDFLE